MHKIPLKALPQRVQASHDPPNTIYSTNDTLVELLQNTICIAIVGSRRPTEYGKRVTKELIQGLSNLPCTIISGMAYGIDSYALQEAVTVGLPTIGVPGSGIYPQVIYPRQSASLAKSITKTGGSVITQFKPNEQSKPWMFPVRNKLMAALCHAVVIIEADHKSGSLITAFHALEFNRDIFSVPGSIFSALSNGTNNLLRHGAIPVLNNQTLRTYILEHPCVQNVLKANKSEAFANNESPASAIVKPQTLTSIENSIISALTEGPKSESSILLKVSAGHKTTSEQLSEILINLEIQGFITQSAGQYILSG